MGKFDKVLAKFDEIIKATENSNYIYRGISKVSYLVESSLLRKNKNLISSGFDLSMIELEKIEIYKKDLFSPSKTNVEVLSEIQHFGGNTTLIDFTMSFYIALFFASESNPNTDGKIIFIDVNDLYALGSKNDLYEFDNKQDKRNILITPVATNNRVLFQRSVFVHSPDGSINENDENKSGKKILKSINVEHKLKRKILEYLNLFCDINYNTVYHDIHGYIKNEENINSPVQLLLKASKDKKDEKYTPAINKYTDYLLQNKATTDDQKNKNKKIYYDRGFCYLKIFRIDKALKDFIEAESMDEILFVQSLYQMWQKKYDLALGTLAGIHQNQNNPTFSDFDVIYLQGLLYEKKTEYEKSKNNYELSLKLLRLDRSKYFERKENDVVKRIEEINQKIELEGNG